MKLRNSIFFNFSGCASMAIKAIEPEIARRGANPLVATPKIGPASNNKYRAISDYISGMTDRYAIQLYKSYK